jgi:hypothetical protein
MKDALGWGYRVNRWKPEYKVLRTEYSVTLVR